MYIYFYFQTDILVCVLFKQRRAEFYEKLTAVLGRDLGILRLLWDYFMFCPVCYPPTDRI